MTTKKLKFVAFSLHILTNIQTNTNINMATWLCIEEYKEEDG